MPTSLYHEAFFLSRPEGNNLFAWDARTHKQLRVPGIISAPLHAVALGSEVVFADHDADGVLQECTGLEHFVRSTYCGVPIVIMDNHNHALFFWCEALAQGSITHPCTLLHIDQHSDMAPNEHSLEDATSLRRVFSFVNSSCNVGNYIDPALRAGVVDRVVSVEGEYDLEQTIANPPWKEKKGSIIVNLDLDFFAPEMNYIPFAMARDFIREACKNATLITVATSPFFIDQKLAIAHFAQIFWDTDA